jgi:hypothetical protein
MESGELTANKEVKESQSQLPPSTETSVEVVPSTTTPNSYVMMQPVFAPNNSSRSLNNNGQQFPVYYVVPMPTYMNSPFQPVFVDQFGNPIPFHHQQQQSN